MYLRIMTFHFPFHDLSCKLHLPSFIFEFDILICSIELHDHKDFPSNMGLICNCLHDIALPPLLLKRSCVAYEP